MAFIERIATAQAHSWWHVSQFLIAEIDGKPAAALCAMPAAGTGAAARSAIEEVGRRDRARRVRTGGDFSTGRLYQAIAGSRAVRADWLIEHVATLPAYRGRGLVQALIDHALAAGRAAGFTRASISFLIGNEAAERCYAKAGFAFAEEKRDPAFEAIHRRARLSPVRARDLSKPCSPGRAPRNPGIARPGPAIAALIRATMPRFSHAVAVATSSSPRLRGSTPQAHTTTI